LLPGRKWFAKYYNSAVAIPSPEFNTICDVAKENNVFLSIGIVEKEGGTLYCTSILLDRKGDLVSSHRKVRISQPQTRLKMGKLTRES
jgi:nitrilase